MFKPVAKFLKLLGMLESMTLLAIVTLLGITSLGSAQAVEELEPCQKVKSTNADQSTILVADNSVAAMEARVHELVNQYRAENNLPPLQLDARISNLARVHSENMARQGSLSHNGFEVRVQTISQSLSLPVRGAAENVASNFGHSDPTLQALEGWKTSSGHNQNMLGRYDLTGIGVAQNPKGEFYVTQVFLKSN